MHRLLGLSAPISAVLLTIGCQMPNPAFDDGAETGETRGQDTLVGDGDGDLGDGDSERDSDTGDGDGDPGTGDGDGETNGDGDGDGDGDGEPNPCNPGQMFCGDACVNIEIDPDHCGDCFEPCPDEQLCGEGMCKPRKLVFATSITHSGNFGGLEGANELCASAAQTGQLPVGEYRAWMTADDKSPASFETEGVYTLRSGKVVAYGWQDMLDGTLAHEISETEFGQPLPPSPACNNTLNAAWTGTSANGTGAPPDCNGWSINGENTLGRVGNVNAIDSSWSDADCLAPCDNLLPIYCVQL